MLRFRENQPYEEIFGMTIIYSFLTDPQTKYSRFVDLASSKHLFSK